MGRKQNRFFDFLRLEQETQGEHFPGKTLFYPIMKIPALAIPAFVAADERFDPNWNRNRPLLSPQRASSIPSLASLFPTQQRRDPALFSRMGNLYFAGDAGNRRFNPVKDIRTVTEDFMCTKESMFLIHQTNQYDAFHTMNFTDFALEDTSCDVNSNHLAWFAVPNVDFTDHGDGNLFNGTDALDCKVDNCKDVAVEYVAAIIPLDSCGTTAEMSTDANGDDIILFKNRVRNGAFNTDHSQASNNGITKDSVVSFDAICSYKASYTMDSNALSFETDQAALADELSLNAGGIFDFDLEFMIEDPAGTLTVEGKTYSAVTGDHSVKVGETAFASIKLQQPIDLIQVQVDACRLKNTGGATPDELSYDFIGGSTSGNNCEDPFTSAKLVNMPNGENGSAFFSWTMFEFIDSALEVNTVQNNFLECDVTICLAGQDCPNKCPT